MRENRLFKPQAINWPNGKKAAFSIIDDTDDAKLPEIRDVYELVAAHGLRTTKTVWVYPVRDKHLFTGDSLLGNPEYLSFIRWLAQRGFEVGLHNVGSGAFTRTEIREGLAHYKRLLGSYPKIHVNHSYNKDNIYGGEKRFTFPLRQIMKRMYPDYSGFEGDVEGSPFFWGDLHKELIEYSRSFELDGLNLLRYTKFPYRDPMYSQYCNLFYPSVFCSNQDLFNHHVTEKSIARLISDGGCSIIYTHLGYYSERGEIDRGFRDRLKLLEKYSDDLWLAPVSEILDHMISQLGVQHLGPMQRFLLECRGLATRVKYRYLVPLDDFHYKSSLGQRHRKSKQ